MPVTLVSGDLPPDLADAMRSSGRVAVDTETSGLDWSRDTLHLCQLYSDATGPVLLRHVSSRPVELGGLFADPAVAKIFHFAPFDLRFLDAQWGLRVVSVECTKAASRLLSPDAPSSAHTLQSILDRHLGVIVEKGDVRVSDWSAATLSSEQVSYAVDDVAHLLTLADVLIRKLEVAGYLDLYRHICAYMPVDAHLAVSGVPNPLIY